MPWTPSEEDREDAAQERERMARESACPHAHTVEELHDTRRLVNGEISGDIAVHLICTDCGAMLDDEYYPGAPRPVGSRHNSAGGHETDPLPF